MEQFEIDPDKKMGELSPGQQKRRWPLRQRWLPVQHCSSWTNQPVASIHSCKRPSEVLKKRNETGLTVFMSSHNLAEVEHFCQKAAFIKEGRLIEVTELGRARENGKIFSVVAPNLIWRL